MNNDERVTIAYDTEFKEDVRRWKKQVVDLQEEIKDVVAYIYEYGYIPVEYNPHPLNDPTLPYYGNMEFHLFDGKLDLVIIYDEVKKHKRFRFIRLGSHIELFVKD